MNTQKRIISTNKFNQETLRLVTEHDLSCAYVARNVGISPDTLARWLRAAVAYSSTSAPITEAGSSTELARLRRALAIVRVERDSFKKAVGTCEKVPQ